MDRIYAPFEEVRKHLDTCMIEVSKTDWKEPKKPVVGTVSVQRYRGVELDRSGRHLYNPWYLLPLPTHPYHPFDLFDLNVTLRIISTNTPLKYIKKTSF